MLPDSRSGGRAGQRRCPLPSGSVRRSRSCVCCECFLSGDLKTLLSSLSLEAVEDTGGVYVGAVVDDTNLGSKGVISDVVSSDLTLARIGEAYAEAVVTCGDSVQRGTGRSKPGTMLSFAASALTATQGAEVTVPTRSFMPASFRVLYAFTDFSGSCSSSWKFSSSCMPFTPPLALISFTAS